MLDKITSEWRSKMFGKKTEIEKKIISFITNDALKGFMEGRFSYLSLIFEAFTINDAIECHKEVAKKFCEFLSKISVKNLIKLSENCRSNFYFYENAVYQYEIASYKVEWKNFKFERNQFKYLSDEEYVSVLRLGTFHSNGFFRQMCMECLSEYKDNLPFYILRINDWVQTIRPLAYELAEKEIKDDDVQVIFSALPMIEKVKNSGRREHEYIDEILVLTEKVILEKIPNCSLYSIVNCEIMIKNIIYRYLCKYNILVLEQMRQLLNMEKTGYGKGLIFEALLNNYDLSINEIDEYLLSKNSIVRFKALEYKYKKLKKSWPGLELMLLDKSRRIRDNVRFMLSRDGSFDVLDYYMNQLKVNNNPVAILGIGECGSSKDIEVILPYLNSDNDIIIKKTLKAYGMLVAYNGSDMYWKYLFNDSDLVSNEAYRLIRKYNVHYGGKQLFETYKKYCNSKIADRLVILLLSEGIWSNMKYLLMLYDDENLSDNIISLIRMKISIRNKYFVSLSLKQKEEIIKVLQNKHSLPQKLVKEILFDLKHI